MAPVVPAFPAITTASIAAMTLGVVLVSMWATTAVVSWWQETHRRRQQHEDGSGS